jgi:hypothetical protein
MPDEEFPFIPGATKLSPFTDHWTVTEVEAEVDHETTLAEVDPHAAETTKKPAPKPRGPNSK